MNNNISGVVDICLYKNTTNIEIISGMVDLFLCFFCYYCSLSYYICVCACLEFSTINAVNVAVEREQVREIEIEEGEPIGVFF